MSLEKEKIPQLIESAKLTDAYDPDSTTTMMITVISGQTDTNRNQNSLRSGRTVITPGQISYRTDLVIERMRVDITALRELGYDVDPSKGYVVTLESGTDQRQPFMEATKATITDARNQHGKRVPARQREELTTLNNQVIGVDLRTNYQKDGRTKSVLDEGLLAITHFQEGMTSSGASEDNIAEPSDTKVTMMHYELDKRQVSKAADISGNMPGKLIFNRDGKPIQGRFYTGRADNTIRGNELDNSLIDLAKNNFDFSDAANFSSKLLFDIDGNPNSAGLAYKNGEFENSGMDNLREIIANRPSAMKYSTYPKPEKCEKVTEAYGPLVDNCPVQSQSTIIKVVIPENDLVKRLYQSDAENPKNSVEAMTTQYYSVDLAELDAAGIEINPNTGNMLSLSSATELKDFQNQFKSRKSITVVDQNGQVLPSSKQVMRITDKETGQLKALDMSAIYSKEGESHPYTLPDGRIIPARISSKLGYSESSRKRCVVTNAYQNVSGSFNMHDDLMDPANPQESLPQAMKFEDGTLISAGFEPKNATSSLKMLPASEIPNAERIRQVISIPDEFKPNLQVNKPASAKPTA